MVWDMAQSGDLVNSGHVYWENLGCVQTHGSGPRASMLTLSTPGCVRPTAPENAEGPWPAAGQQQLRQPLPLAPTGEGVTSFQSQLNYRLVWEEFPDTHRPAGFPLLGAPKCFILSLFYCNCFWNYLSWLWDLVGQEEGLLGPSFVPRPKRGPRTQGLLNKSSQNNLYCFPRQGKMEMTWVHYMKGTSGAYTFAHCLRSSESGVQDSWFSSFRP